MEEIPRTGCDGAKAGRKLFFRKCPDRNALDDDKEARVAEFVL